MLTILSVCFTKTKLYDYLLDSRSVVKPKIGSVLKLPRSFTSRGCTYDDIKVMKIRQEKYLPESVYTVLRIMDKDMYVSSHKMAQPTLKRLRPPKVVKRKKKELHGKTEYPAWMYKPIVGNLSCIDLTTRFASSASGEIRVIGRRKHYGR